MIWLRDIRRIQYFLDFIDGPKKLAIDVKELSIPFLDWLHEEIMKSKFTEPKKVVEGLKDARRAIIVYQDDGEFPFGKFTPKESKERDDFIINKTLKYLKINLTKKERKAAEKQVAKKPITSHHERSSFQKHVKRTGRGPAWYYPSSWEEK